MMLHMTYICLPILHPLVLISIFCCSAIEIVYILDFSIPFVVDPRSDSSEEE
jgi:hypothetical protein